MTKLSFLFIFSCFMLPYGGKTFAQEHELTERIKQLETAFSEKDYGTFFATFPNSFSELEAIYGYAEVAMPLYHVANEHIDFLFDERKDIDMRLFVEKICTVGINGKWEADAVNYFQNHVSVLLHLPPMTRHVVEFLNTKTKSEIESFWRFVMDDPVPRKDYFAEIYPAVRKIDKKQARMIKKEWQKMQKAYKNELPLY